MSTSHSDRRNSQRRSSSLYLQFKNIRTGELIGDLADISRDGFMLESMKPIPLNAEFSFGVELPPEISRKPFIEFTARSKWSRPDPIDTRVYDTGFEIIQMNPNDAQAFELIIERYGSNRTGRM